MSQKMVSAYLLAAGESKRMGSAKPLLDFGGKTVLEKMVSAFREGGIADVTVVIHEGDAKLAAEAQRLKISAIENRAMEKGMAGSILAAIGHCRGDWLAVSPADMPLLTAATIQSCVAALESDPIAPSVGGRRRHPVFIPESLFAELGEVLQNGTLRDLLGKRPPFLVESPQAWQFEDMDTPEDYRRLLALVK